MSKIIKEKSSNAAFIPKADLQVMKRAKLVLRALDHSLRQTILELIDKKKEVAVTEIYSKLKLEQSVASQHLAILRATGFVKTRRDGKFIYYSVDHNNIDEAIKISNAMTTLMPGKKL